MHCATRLRMVIADNSKVNNEALEEVDGVKGVFEASGQLQIIFGTGVVNKVYDEFIAIAGITSSTKEEVKKAAASKGNPFQRFIKTLGDIFVPIIPAIVASGFLMGIMETLNFLINNGYVELSNESSLFVLANMFANTAYVFLPVLIGFSAAKVFGGNPFLGGVIGMIMVHPNLQNAWTMTGGGCGAMFASVTSLGATGTGVTGIFGILLCLNAPVKYILMFAISAGVAFVLTWLFGYQNSKDVDKKAKETEKPAAFEKEPEMDGALHVSAPVSGKVVSLNETGDQTFAAEVIGKGAAIEPSEGKVYAPFDATIRSVMGHAIGLEGKNGVEVLIHIGIDTVKLEGKYYTPHCSQEQEVKAGDLLMEFDMEKIQAEGYRTITPVIVTNTDAYESILAHMDRTVSAGEELLTINK